MPRPACVFQPAVWAAQARLAAKTAAAWPAAEAMAIAHPLGHRGFFRVACTGRVLEIAAEILPPVRPAAPHVPMPEWHLQDHVVIFLDPAHDHTTQRMVAVLRTGELKTQDTWFLNGEEVSDTQTVPLKLPALRPECQVRERSDGGWRFRLRVKLAQLRRQPGVLFPAGPLGLRIKMACAGAVIHDAPAWPTTDPFWKDGPFGFGDVYGPSTGGAAQAQAQVRVTALDFGAPVWNTGALCSRLKLSTELGGRKLRAGRVRVTLTDTVGGSRTQAVEWSAGRGARPRVRVTVPTPYPFTAKWAPDIRRIARVGITIEDSRGRVLWQAGFPFGFDAGVLVREPFGLKQGRKTLARPQPADPDFVDRFRAWLIARLPAWQWRTTRNGAPSDFFLAAARSRDSLNLMSPTVFTDLARLIHRRFPDWQDGLCAAAMALHHPCLTVHSTTWARIAGTAHTDTVLRLGGTFCSDDARLAARLADELGRLYRVPLRGFELGLRGHLTGLVETPVGEVLIDPMLGLYYHTLDNTRLATLAEMRQDPRIHQRMWALAFSNGHEFFHGVNNQIKRPWLNGPTRFPPGS